MRPCMSMSYSPPLHNAPCISHDRFFCILDIDRLLHWLGAGHRQGMACSIVPGALHGHKSESLAVPSPLSPMLPPSFVGSAMGDDG